jgi:hypothetical protein
LACLVAQKGRISVVPGSNDSALYRPVSRLQTLLFSHESRQRTYEMALAMGKRSATLRLSHTTYFSAQMGFPMVDDETDRMLGEERPGPDDIESVLAEDTLADVLHGPPLFIDASASLAEALRLMREQRRGYVLAIGSGQVAGIFTERYVLMKVAGQPPQPRARSGLCLHDA